MGAPEFASSCLDQCHVPFGHDEEINDYCSDEYEYSSADDYEHLKVISNGAYGVVHKVRNKKTGEILAMKEEFHGLSTSTLREIQVLSLLPYHPSIVQFKEVVVSSDGHIFVGMEYVETDLFKYMNMIRKEPPFTIGEIKLLMKQLLEGVGFLHEHGVMHRDLKPSNILLNERRGQLKICDFGLSRGFDVNEESGSYTPGMVTLWYRAPELLYEVNKYSSAIDMWSVGCIMAEFVLKKVLFKGSTETDQLCTIFRILGIPDKDGAWPAFSGFSSVLFSVAPMLTENGIDLLQKLLAYDPKKRITAKAALNHPWFREYYGFSAR